MKLEAKLACRHYFNFILRYILLIFKLGRIRLSELLTTERLSKHTVKIRNYRELQMSVAAFTHVSIRYTVSGIPLIDSYRTYGSLDFRAAET